MLERFFPNLYGALVWSGALDLILRVGPTVIALVIFGAACFIMGILI